MQREGQEMGLIRAGAGTLVTDGDYIERKHVATTLKPVSVLNFAAVIVVHCAHGSVSR